MLNYQKGITIKYPCKVGEYHDIQYVFDGFMGMGIVFLLGGWRSWKTDLVVILWE